MINKIYFKEWFISSDFIFMESVWTDAKNKFINQGHPENNVNLYIDRFRQILRRQIRQDVLNAPLENLQGVTNRKDIGSYKRFEQLIAFVDYVFDALNLNQPLQQTAPKPSRKEEDDEVEEDIEVDGEKIFEDKNLIIYRADAPSACIRYKGKQFDYSWCVSRLLNQGNMYYTYRYGSEERTFYFVKNKIRTHDEFAINPPTNRLDIKDKYHFFVLQVIKPGIKDFHENDIKYRVTSSKNDGDTIMSWNQIVTDVEPLLAGKEELFAYKHLSEEEKAIYRKFQMHNPSPEEFARLSDEEKKQYISFQFRPLPDDLFDMLTKELQNYYINSRSYALTLNQFNKISPTLKKRYIKLEAFPLTDQMFATMCDKLKEYYIAQSKSILSIAQYNALSVELKEFYNNSLREKVIASVNDDPNNVFNLEHTGAEKILIENFINGNIIINGEHYTERLVQTLCKIAHNHNVLQDTILKIIPSKNKWSRFLIKYFIRSAQAAKPVIKALKKNIKELGEDDIRELFATARDSEGVANELQDAPELFQHMNISQFCRHRFTSSKRNCDPVIISYIKNKEELSIKNIYDCLYNSHDTMRIVNAINSRNEELMGELNRSHVYDLIRTRTNANKLKIMGIALGQNNLNKLTQTDVAKLVQSVSEGEEGINVRPNNLAAVLGVNNIQKINDMRTMKKYHIDRNQMQEMLAAAEAAENNENE